MFKIQLLVLKGSVSSLVGKAGLSVL